MHNGSLSRVLGLTAVIFFFSALAAASTFDLGVKWGNSGYSLILSSQSLKYDDATLHQTIPNDSCMRPFLEAFQKRLRAYQAHSEIPLPDRPGLLHLTEKKKTIAVSPSTELGMMLTQMRTEILILSETYQRECKK